MLQDQNLDAIVVGGHAEPGARISGGQARLTLRVSRDEVQTLISELQRGLERETGDVVVTLGVIPSLPTKGDPNG